MKASYRWLCELIPGLEAKASAEAVATAFTNAGLEVEAMHEFGAASRHVLVARVVKVEPHPSKSNLRLVTCEGRDAVVCGAPNVPDPGGLVVLAPNGTHLPAKGMTLEPKAIGGVVSAGMLCSEAELGLRTSGGEAGILILPQGAKVGATLAEVVPESHDWILEIGLTPNRPDGLGHVGLARELAALLDLPFEVPAPAKPLDGRIEGGIVGAVVGAAFGPAGALVGAAAGALLSPSTLRTEDRVKVRIDDLERCPHYGATVVTGVTVAPSPLGLTYRLESLGIRSISNVVDVTNLILLKWGHPIHGFDLSLVRGGEIVVRRARDGEKLVTLDGASHALDGDDLVIADAEGGVALAGVMGGAGSELRDTTTDVLVECAYFAPRGVRRSARRHGMHTESSHRFERGVDPGDIDHVLADTAALLASLAGGTPASTRPIYGEPLPEKKLIELRKARMDALLGLAIPLAEAKRTLARLGCEIAAESEASLSVRAPTHRPDLGMEEDLIEEVVRVFGMDRVAPHIPAIVPQLHDRRGVMQGRLRSSAVGVGLSEALTMAFVAQRDLALVRAPAATFVLKNPLSEERDVMRTSLLPGLVESARRARRHGVTDVRLFTMGARFMPRPPAGTADDALADEVPSFAAILAGHRDTQLGKPARLDIYDVKGVALEIVGRATSREASAVLQPEATRAPHLHPRGAAHVVVDGEVVGSFGPLHPVVVRDADLGGEAFVIELDVRALEKVGRAHRRYRAIPTLPAATRDISVVVHEDVTADTVVSAIREAGGELCESALVFDLYRGDQLPRDHRSLAFHVVYRDPKAATDPAHAKTLTDAEVDQRHAAVTKSITERFGAVLRA
ncbi:MAG: phenylalanine--tRNA ligase subunit beta [Polyangiaceae bacterium]